MSRNSGGSQRADRYDEVFQGPSGRGGGVLRGVEADLRVGGQALEAEGRTLDRMTMTKLV